VEAHRPALEGVHAIEDEHVQVTGPRWLEVQCAAEALHHRHRAGPRAGRARQVGPLDQISLDGAEDHGETARERLGA
jgi:hypothetical protein